MAPGRFQPHSISARLVSCCCASNPAKLAHILVHPGEFCCRAIDEGNPDTTECHIRWRNPVITAKWIVCFPGSLLLVARRTASLRTGGSGHRRHPTPPGGLGWPEKGPCAAGQRGKARGQEPERATNRLPTPDRRWTSHTSSQQLGHQRNAKKSRGSSIAAVRLSTRKPQHCAPLRPHI